MELEGGAESECEFCKAQAGKDANEQEELTVDEKTPSQTQGAVKKPSLEGGELTAEPTEAEIAKHEAGEVGKQDADEKVSDALKAAEPVEGNPAANDSPTLTEVEGAAKHEIAEDDLSSEADLVSEQPSSEIGANIVADESDAEDLEEGDKKDPSEGKLRRQNASHKLVEGVRISPQGSMEQNQQ